MQAAEKAKIWAELQRASTEAKRATALAKEAKERAVKMRARALVAEETAAKADTMAGWAFHAEVVATEALAIAKKAAAAAKVTVRPKGSILLSGPPPKKPSFETIPIGSKRRRCTATKSATKSSTSGIATPPLKRLEHIPTDVKSEKGDEDTTAIQHIATDVESEREVTRVRFQNLLPKGHRCLGDAYADGATCDDQWDPCVDGVTHEV